MLQGPNLAAAARRLRRHRPRRSSPPAASPTLADLEALMGLVADGRRGRDRRHRALRGPVHPRGRAGPDPGPGGGGGEPRRPGDPVPGRRRRPGGQGRQLPGAARRRRPGRAGPLYDAEGADELTFLDISASHEGRATTMEIVSRTAEEVFIPLTVGGGVSVGRRRRPAAARRRRQGRGQHRRDPPARAGRRDRRPVRQPGAGAVRRRPPGAAGTDVGLRGHHPRRPEVRRARRDRVGRRAPPSSAPARSCSTRWTPTAPRTASTSS